MDAIARLDIIGASIYSASHKQGPLSQEVLRILLEQLSIWQFQVGFTSKDQLQSDLWVFMEVVKLFIVLRLTSISFALLEFIVS